MTSCWIELIQRLFIMLQCTLSMTSAFILS